MGRAVCYTRSGNILSSLSEPDETAELAAVGMAC